MPAPYPWWPLNEFFPPVGAYLWNLYDHDQYPFAVPTYPVIKGWARFNELDGEGWVSQYTYMPDVQVEVPPANVTFAGVVFRADNMVGLVDYPMDEVPAEYLVPPLGPVDRFEVWTGPSKTGGKLTEIASTYSGAMPASTFMVDYASGMVRFSPDLEGSLLYCTYFGLQGANRGAWFHFLMSNQAKICSALLVGFTHGLKFIMSLQPGSQKYIDFSGITGTPEAGDWVFYFGDGGGILDREAGLTADSLVWVCNGILPASDAFI